MNGALDRRQMFKLEIVLEDIAAERERQVAKGWTPEHDDAHGASHLIRHAWDRAASARNALMTDREAARAEIVKSAALLVAAAEALDRLEDA